MEGTGNNREEGRVRKIWSRKKIHKKVNLKKSFPETIQRMDVLGKAKAEK